MREGATEAAGCGLLLFGFAVGTLPAAAVTYWWWNYLGPESWLLGSGLVWGMAKVIMCVFAFSVITGATRTAFMFAVALFVTATKPKG